ncbi:uncharacterized protein AB675_9550 [Cyphellophora attinorum]|uniref:Uncharacterized protein n=1 Tax=Cyphellophora attinorum TaxID=1664694 RepID=A0A0N0NP64_9EURO|nr:uncharacterized protein AB675_9550 [Phialophora attinorum]KPI42358.1 hypothetical protein AB675_9550 [Phialophora attinorum]
MQSNVDFPFSRSGVPNTNNRSSSNKPANRHSPGDAWSMPLVYRRQAYPAATPSSASNGPQQIRSRMRIGTVLNEDDDTDRSTSPSTASSSWSPPPPSSQTSHSQRLPKPPRARRSRTKSTHGKSTKKGPPRPCRPYSNEKQIAIWYFRKDMAFDWDIVEAKYNSVFQDQRSLGALRCRFYRVLSDWGVEKVRDQFHSRTGRNDPADADTAAYGVVVSLVAERVIIADVHRNAQIVCLHGCDRNTKFVPFAAVQVIV